MFTGIIEEIGILKAIHRGASGCSLDIQASTVLRDLRPGDSVATNGVCLTATSIGTGSFRADVMPETMRRTNLGTLLPGSRLNLERALTLSARLGGHIVSGHIDGTGTITAIRHDDNATWYTIAASPAILRYIVEKGSIAIDGISLTVAAVTPADFQVSTIPHTRSATTLTDRRVGDIVNLENDLIAKYIERLALPRRHTPSPSPGGLTLEFLHANGF